VGSKKHSHDDRSLVFFVRQGDDEGSPRGLLFIGDSTGPTKVFAEMQDLSPVSLVYLGAVKGRHYPLGWWKSSLLPWHVRDASVGAWFRCTAQVLCLIEDVQGHRVNPPGPHYDAPSAIPEHIRPLTKMEKAKRRWAFPTPDPYPKPSPESSQKVAVGEALPLVLKVLESSSSGLLRPPSSSLPSESYVVEALKAG
jgi:hypothetical protein